MYCENKIIQKQENKEQDKSEQNKNYIKYLKKWNKRKRNKIK